MMPRGALFMWYFGGMLAAVAIGWFAARLHAAGIAPVGLMSLLIGAMLGAALAALAASQLTASDPAASQLAASRAPRLGVVVLAGSCPLVIGTILLALVTILAEHAWLYRDFRRQWQDARAESAEVALFRPEQPWSPHEYFAWELSSGRAALWALDAVLVIAAAVTVVIVVVRRRPPK
jgi:hypothetical protein